MGTSVSYHNGSHLSNCTHRDLAWLSAIGQVSPILPLFETGKHRYLYFYFSSYFSSSFLVGFLFVRLFVVFVFEVGFLYMGMVVLKLPYGYLLGLELTETSLPLSPKC